MKEDGLQRYRLQRLWTYREWIGEIVIDNKNRTQLDHVSMEVELKGIERKGKKEKEKQKKWKDMSGQKMLLSNIMGNVKGGFVYNGD